MLPKCTAILGVAGSSSCSSSVTGHEVHVKKERKFCTYASATASTQSCGMVPQDAQRAPASPGLICYIEALASCLVQPRARCLHYAGCRAAYGEQMGSPGCQCCPLGAHAPFGCSSPQPKVWLCFCSHHAVVDCSLPPGSRGLRVGLCGGLPFPSPAIAAVGCSWVKVQRGLAPVPAFQGCVHSAPIGDA